MSSECTHFAIWVIIVIIVTPFSGR